jgi:hypothetical protein
MLNQQFIELIAEYRKPEFGEAVLAIFDFYVNTCGGDVNRIEDEYINQYDREFMTFGTPEFDPAKTLHFQRRLVDQYYWLMGELMFNKDRSVRLPEKELKQWITPNEPVLLNILFRMNKASERRFVNAENIPEYDGTGDDGLMDEIRNRFYKAALKWADRKRNTRCHHIM